MNCKNCYQEISDGSKFCPHCGAKQNEVQPNAEQENAVKNDPVQATGAAKTTENAAGYQDVSGYQNNGGYQDAAGYQNNSGYQDAAGYQNNSGYQNVTGYQNNGQKPEINYVPYLVLSIISTVCCCLPRTRCLIRIRRRRRRSTGYRTLYYLLFVRCAVVFRSVS